VVPVVPVVPLTYFPVAAWWEGDDWLWVAVEVVSALTRRVEGGRADWLVG
jgi:hypothetical protein